MLTAVDASGTRVTSYTGTVTLSSSDHLAAEYLSSNPKSALPNPNVSFAPSNNGQRRLTVQLGTNGGQTFTATDRNGLTGTSNVITVTGGQPSSAFVYTCGMQLCLNGLPFVIHGGTTYGQMNNPSGEVALANQSRLNVLEVVKFDPALTLANATSEAVWTPVDKMIAAAQSGGLHIVLHLSSYGQALAAAGQKPTTTDWQPFLSFVANRVNTVTNTKYANDPTIAMIEMYGEIAAPNYTNDPTRGTTAETTSFFQRTLAQWKTLDPNHVASTGGFSYINDPNSGIDWQTIVRDPNNATCDVEINSQGDRDVSVPNMSAYCKSINKPWFLSAWSSCQVDPTKPNTYNYFLDDTAMAAHATDMYNVARNTNPTAPGPAIAAAGSDFWNLGSTPAKPGNCDIGPQYPLTMGVVKNRAP